MADPRIVDFENDVSRCVNELGFQYTTIEDAYNMIQSEITNLQEVEYSESEAEDEGYKGLPVLDQRQREKLADIQEREIKLALAVQDCGGMESNLYDLIRSVTYEYESEFIEQNALRLAEYRLSDR